MIVQNSVTYYLYNVFNWGLLYPTKQNTERL